MKGKRITIRIEDSDKEAIEKFVKENYPKIKTTSEAIRLAIRKLLKDIIKTQPQTQQTHD
jgi:Arc/MetJ-type ribon-helix-helix transcriptional regulator